MFPERNYRDKSVFIKFDKWKEKTLLTRYYVKIENIYMKYWEKD